MTACGERRLRAAFTLLFVFVVIDGLTAFGVFMVIRDGAVEVPDGVHSAPIRDHGSTYYVTPIEAALYHALLVTMLVGVPLVILAGAVLELGLGVRVFSGPAPGWGADGRQDRLESTESENPTDRGEDVSSTDQGHRAD